MRVTFCPINIRSILVRIVGGQDVAERRIRSLNEFCRLMRLWRNIFRSCLLSYLLAPFLALKQVTTSQGDSLKFLAILASCAIF